MKRLKVRHSLYAAIPLAALIFASELRAAKVCCDIIQVDPEKGVVWVRNPVNALLAQFNPGTDGIKRFKVGDRFHPDTSILNGVKLGQKFTLVEPDLDPPNATIISVIGARITAKGKENGKAYRFSTLAYGPVLSSLRPGQEIVIDESGKWAIIRWASDTEASILGPASGRKPQTYAYQLK